MGCAASFDIVEALPGGEMGEDIFIPRALCSALPPCCAPLPEPAGVGSAAGRRAASTHHPICLRLVTAASQCTAGAGRYRPMAAPLRVGTLLAARNNLHSLIALPALGLHPDRTGFDGPVNPRRGQSLRGGRYGAWDPLALVVPTRTYVLADM